jgi:ribose 5-phosphate isomerase A
MSTDDDKKLAATRAAEYVRGGMLVGLGSGSTAELVVAELGRRVAAGLAFRGVASSNRTRELCERCRIPILDVDDVGGLDLVIDGADEVDPAFQMIKGRGGALMREKIVASSAERVVIVVDGSKLVNALGKAPVPVEVVPFGWKQTAKRIAALGAVPALRRSGSEPVVSDNGNYTLDCQFASAIDPAAVHQRLKLQTGVVETGLFVDLCDVLVVARAGQVEARENPRRRPVPR